MHRITSKEKNKLPSYVAIYNVLYHEIVNGVYPNGSLLPSENQLTQKYQVSRNTLRQALTILTQDGYIYKKQGKGTYISYLEENDNKNEKFFNFLIACALEPIQKVKMKYNIGLPTMIAKKKLKLSDGEEVVASNNIYLSDEVMGYAFVQIPMKYVGVTQLSLEDEEQLYELMNHRIYQDTKQADIKVNYILANSEQCKFLKCKESEPLLFLEQVLYGGTGYPLARVKYYFLQDQYQVSFKI